MNNRGYNPTRRGAQDYSAIDSALAASKEGEKDSANAATPIPQEIIALLGQVTPPPWHRSAYHDHKVVARSRGDASVCDCTNILFADPSEQERNAELIVACVNFVAQLAKSDALISAQTTESVASGEKEKGEVLPNGKGEAPGSQQPEETGLAPCPLCGDEVVFGDNTSGRRYCDVICDRCNLQLHAIASSRNLSRLLWNRRVPLIPAREPKSVEAELQPKAGLSGKPLPQLVDELRRQLSASKEREAADTERLDWLETVEGNRWVSGFQCGGEETTIREAIDAARGVLGSGMSAGETPVEEPSKEEEGNQSLGATQSSDPLT